MMCSSFSAVLVDAGFELNKKYIVAKLCENRDRPWMQCQGKCILAKKLKAAQEKEAKEMYKVPQHEAILVQTVLPEIFIESRREQNGFYSDFKFVSFYLKDIFHPPIFTV
jgi:hypothetical protein